MIVVLYSAWTDVLCKAQCSDIKQDRDIILVVMYESSLENVCLYSKYAHIMV